MIDETMSKPPWLIGLFWLAAFAWLVMAVVVARPSGTSGGVRLRSRWL
jgi:hypothetical protein